MGDLLAVDRRVCHIDFSSVFIPNTAIPYQSGGLTYDIEFSSQKGGDRIDNPTYAAITVRSYHPNIVNASLMEGSVRSYDDGIDR